MIRRLPKVWNVNPDESRLALRWLSDCSAEQCTAIMKAWRSVDALGVDGTKVLIAAYRSYHRMLKDTIPG